MKERIGRETLGDTRGKNNIPRQSDRYAADVAFGMCIRNREL